MQLNLTLPVPTSLNEDFAIKSLQRGNKAGYTNGIVTHRTCSKCKEMKELNDFPDREKGLFGKHYMCEECLQKGKDQYNERKQKYQKEYQKKYYEENKDRLKEYQKQYYTDNFDEIKIKNAEYCQRNKRRISEYYKEWRKDNKEYLTEYYENWKNDNLESISLYKSKYYQENKDRIIEYKKQWYKDNPHKRQYASAKRKAYKRGIYPIL